MGSFTSRLSFKRTWGTSLTTPFKKRLLLRWKKSLNLACILNSQESSSCLNNTKSKITIWETNSIMWSFSQSKWYLGSTICRIGTYCSLGSSRNVKRVSTYSTNLRRFNKYWITRQDWIIRKSFLRPISQIKSF